MNYIQSIKEKGVEIIALDADETDIAVKNFVKQYDLKFPVAIDKGGEIIKTYGVIPLPTSFLIDKDGKVIQEIKGEQTKEQLEEYLKKNHSVIKKTFTYKALTYSAFGLKILSIAVT